MNSKSEYDMDLNILVERKQNTNNSFIGNFTILTQLCDFFLLCFDFLFNTNNFFIGNFTILTQLCDFFVVF